MRVIRGLADIDSPPGSVVTIGTFDGVHLGHHELLAYLDSRARHHGGQSILITFEPHPRLVLGRPGDRFNILTTLDEKIAVLESSDLDILLVVPFTKKFSQITGTQFIEDIIIAKLNPTEVVVGYDHAFGHRRSGSIDTLRQYVDRGEFRLNVFEPFSIDGDLVKSTPIRKYLVEGNLELANRLLGREYEVSGSVVSGAGRGRRLKYPTANLEPDSDHKLIPGDGIFAAKVLVEGSWHQAAVSIGIRPTYNETEKTIEAFLLDFDEDIYGKKITIQFIKRLRDELKFESEAALIRQIEVDVAEAKKCLEQIEVISEE